MAETDALRPPFPRNPQHAAPPHEENICAQSVLSAYTAAMEHSRSERSAYDAAVQTYRLYHPNLPQAAARRAVALIISSKD
jgi:hypothetical protein